MFKIAEKARLSKRSLALQALDKEYAAAGYRHPRPFLFFTPFAFGLLPGSFHVPVPSLYWVPFAGFPSYIILGSLANQVGLKDFARSLWW